MVIVTAVDDASDRNVVEAGHKLANAFGEELHVVHVRDREEIEETSGGDETALEGAANTAADIADDVTDEYTSVGRIGNPTQELIDYIDEADAGYLVIGGRKRTPIGKALFGSTTQSVLLSVDIPVLTVPDSE